MKEAVYPSDFDCIWLATDEDGHVAAFATGGNGPIPQTYCQSPSTFNETGGVLNSLPEMSEVNTSCDYPRPDDFVALAARGIFAFDWSDVHRTKDFLRSYELLAAPKTPVNVSSLSQSAQTLITHKFSGVRFGSMRTFDPRDHTVCVDDIEKGLASKRRVGANQIEADITSYWSIFRRAAAWLCLLAPFFYLTYGIANWLASQRAHVPNLAFGWESAIPFYAWTIVPYWSINAFYALSLFINDTPAAVDRLAKRYLTAQIVAVTCFIAFPLTATFARPETIGLPGFMFDVLGGFDKPFNQAPSLHIALLVIIWDHLRRKLPGGVRQVWHVWCFLIGASVLTTYQHHFIDIPTGALLGLFALWLFPHGAPSPLAGFRVTTSEKAGRLGRYYAGGAIVFLILAASGVFLTGYALLLLWPALALAIVSVGYFGAGREIFQKAADGSVSLASHWLLMPYRFGARLNIRYWTGALPARTEITEKVFLGRFPNAGELSDIATVIDLTGELTAPRHDAKTTWKSFPSLDLMTTPDETLAAASDAIETSRPNGPVLVCCALGFQRSAATVVHWLVTTGRAASRDAAIDLLKSKGRPVHLPASEPKRTA